MMAQLTYIQLSKKLRLIILLFFLLVGRPWYAACQKYNFTQYDIEDGLTQSQVSLVTQDNSHHLVVATKLGIGRFDGKTFASITKDNGLPDNEITSIASDKKGRLWCSSAHGLFYYYEGKIHKYATESGSAFMGASVLLTGRNDVIWGIKNHTLFKLAARRASRINILNDAENISAIAKDSDGNLLAAIYNRGIYRLENNKWTEVVSPAKLNSNTVVKQVMVDDNDPDHFYILTNDELLSAKSNAVQPLQIDLPAKIPYTINFLCQDNQHGLWIASARGAYHFDLTTGNFKYFDENNGFTSNSVNHIFRDVDNEIWFGTNGAGLYRYNGDSFVAFSQTRGFADPNIMQFARDGNRNILIASSGTGLFAYDGKTMNRIDIPSTNPLTKKVFCIGQLDNKTVYVGTLFGGLWKKTGNEISRVYPRTDIDEPLSFNDIKKDENDTLWFATATGCYYLNKNQELVKVLFANCRSLKVLGHDSVLVAINNGVVLLKNKKIDHSFKAPFLKESFTMCINYYHGRVYVGTVDNGLFVWDLRTGKFIKLDKKSGLSANSVYSIGIDANDVLWVGTGRGINKLRINADGSFASIVDDDISNLIVECNQNSLAFFNNQVWIGTTRGLVVLKDKTSPRHATIPYTIMQDVQFFNDQQVKYYYKDGYRLPHNLALPFNNSHITLGFKGINLKNSSGVLYSYKLSPIENRFSPLSKNDVVDYPSLPPGEYVFNVKSLVPGGRQSNTATFSFEITPAYYQTVLFKICAVLLCLFTGISVFNYYKTKEKRKQRLIENLRMEEQVKIRKQTAEDFHDDLGNKLTRINVLSDILYKKANAHYPEDKKIISQIKESADALFTGSKHILWALDPDNDQLTQVLHHIADFGIDMFANTGIHFLPQISLMEFSRVTLLLGRGRNIILIIKELLNNVLKHSEAKNVVLSTSVNGDKNICISIEDDGKG
ncbi:MAG: two-component regulator propeller domain-containing protein, partial [Mucilaginibacter sp.]